MAATDAQVQVFVDTRIRPFCEQARALKAEIDDIIAQISDVYAALTEPTPTWRDQRTDGPPKLLAPSDVLAINTAMHDLQTAINGEAQWPIVLEACVRALLG